MNPVVDANLRRIAFASLVAPVVNLVHIILFGLDLDKGTAIEHTWRVGIIASHSVLIVLFTAFGLSAWWLRRRPHPSELMGKGISHAFYFLILVVGTAIALIDQLVTSALTPYLFVSILVPLVAQLPPRGPLVYHTLVFLLFVFVLPSVQMDANVRLSNLVNALTGLGAGVFLNLLFWNFQKTKTEQDERIARQTRELMEMNQTRNRFFSIIAHDLRSPFAGFMGMLEVLRDRNGDLSAEDRTEALDVLHQSSVSLYRLLENLLTWSKAQQNLIEVRPEVVDLVSFLETVREPFRGMEAEKRLQVSTKCRPGLTLHTDPLILETILRNLFSNALKFTPMGGRIELTIETPHDAPQDLEFSCFDTGIGIPEATQSSLFELDRPGGLGLILCNDFVGRLGGRLQVESQPGGPTRFWFRLRHQ